MSDLVKGLIFAGLLVGAANAGYNNPTSQTGTDVIMNHAQTEAVTGKFFSKEYKTIQGTKTAGVANIDYDPNTSTDADYFEIDGMPCVVLSYGVSVNGISCDWNRWKGNTYAEQEAEYEAIPVVPMEELDIVKQFIGG